MNVVKTCFGVVHFASKIRKILLRSPQLQIADQISEVPTSELLVLMANKHNLCLVSDRLTEFYHCTFHCL